MSIASKHHFSSFKALPSKEHPKTPGKASGNKVKTVAFHGSIGVFIFMEGFYTVLEGIQIIMKPKSSLLGCVPSSLSYTPRDNNQEIIIMYAVSSIFLRNNSFFDQNDYFAAPYIHNRGGFYVEGMKEHTQLIALFVFASTNFQKIPCSVIMHG